MIRGHELFQSERTGHMYIVKQIGGGRYEVLEAHATSVGEFDRKHLAVSSLENRR